MFSPFERFVAFRYLRGLQGREEGRDFLRFITYVAVGGVAVGVAALLLALSIVHGFSGEIKAKIMGFGAHVQVERFQDAPLDDADRLAQRLAGVEHVDHVAPIVQEFVLLRHSAQEIDGVALWGVEAPPVYLKSRLVEGRFRFAPNAQGHPGVVLGRQLARRLGVKVGDRVTVFSTRGLSQGATAGLTSRPRVKQFYVAGFYETLLADFDDVNVLTSLTAARDLLAYGPEQVTRFDLTLRDVERADEVTRRVEDQFGFPLIARTIQQVYPGLFAWVNLQEGIIPLVISVIVVVAAFNIVGTLLMIILEKTREIGILASMGVSRRSLRRLFLGLGLLIGAVGTALGEGIALVLALLQARYELIPLPAEAYYMDAAPIELHLLDFVGVGVVALALCAVAAYVPARFASRVEPVRVIRFR